MRPIEASFSCWTRLAVGLLHALPGLQQLARHLVEAPGQVADLVPRGDRRWPGRNRRGRSGPCRRRAGGWAG
ncbi:MAG: hypothetical protein MZV63_63160 [Marinilabiliales bacterium]|nr:hypothetical protein [Marinilabiliales bacterium]